MSSIEIPSMEPQGDFVDGDSSPALLGATIEYRYSRGTHYRLAFDHEFHVDFAELDDAGQRLHETPILPYRARDIRDGLVLVHWLVKPASIHVALTIDLTERRLHVAAMMPPNRWEFFDTAEITEVRLAGPV